MGQIIDSDDCPICVEFKDGWIFTYGDLVTLLLCFFILLQMFSEFKKDHEYQRVVTAIQEAFGFSGGVGVLPTDDIPARSMIEILESMTVQRILCTSRQAGWTYRAPSARPGLLPCTYRLPSARSGWTQSGLRLPTLSLARYNFLQPNPMQQTSFCR